jgi:hypothetical protein
MTPQPEDPQTVEKTEKKESPAAKNIYDVLDTVARAVPFGKLRRYEVANLSFDAIAIYFTYNFATKYGATLPVLILWFAVLSLCLACVFWASKQ